MKAKVAVAIYPIALITAVLCGSAVANPLVPGGQIEPTVATRYLDGGRARLAIRGTPEGTLTPIYIEVPDGRGFHAKVDAHALVRLAPGVDAGAIWARFGLTPVREISPSLGWWRVRGRAGEDGLAVAARLAPSLGGALVGAEPDLYLAQTLHTMDAPPNDPHFPGQWFLERVSIMDAWAISTGSADVTVVVVDGGCAVAHPDLAAKMDPGYDAVDDDDDPNPQLGFPSAEHGTAVAGIIGAETNNDLGVAGACPECRMRSVRLLAEDGHWTPISTNVAAFDFALEHDAWIVNNSWGFVEAIPVPASLATSIINVATESRGGLGALVVFASGNDSREINDDELLAVPYVLGVGATNNFDELTQFSNFGRSVDIVAPTGTLTTDIPGAAGADPGDYTHHFGGTSSSAPLVSGLAGLLMGAAPNATAVEVHDALIATAQQSFFATPNEEGHDLEYGYGVVRPAAALRVLLGLPDPSELPDAGVDAEVDAEVADAEVDAELEADGGVNAGLPVDADEQEDDDGGCAVSLAGGPSGFGLVWLMAMMALPLVVLRRRRLMVMAGSYREGAGRSWMAMDGSYRRVAGRSHRFVAACRQAFRGTMEG